MLAYLLPLDSLTKPLRDGIGTLRSNLHPNTSLSGFFIQPLD